MKEPELPAARDEDPKKGSGLGTVVKLLLTLLALGIALAVLAFGTCVLMFSR